MKSRAGACFLLAACALAAPAAYGGRLLDDASSQYLEATAAPLGATPTVWTLAVWVKSDDVDRIQGIVCNSDADANMLLAVRFHDTGTGQWQTQSYDGTNNANIIGNDNPANNVWHHGCYTRRATTDHESYLNGVSEGTSATNPTLTGVDTISIGRLNFNSSPGSYYGGDVGYVAIWNAGMTAAEVGELAKGRDVRTCAKFPVAYWPLDGSSNPEPDVIGGFNLTNTGSTKIGHKPLGW
jgi:hypothetical protein